MTEIISSPTVENNPSNLYRNRLLWLISNNPLRFLGAAILMFMVSMATLAPFIAPYDPYLMGWDPFLQPNDVNILGTDHMGKDIFSQLIYASQISLTIGFAAATVAILVGVGLGIIAGYHRGHTEDLILGVTDLFMLIPGLPLMILFASYLGPSVINLVLVITLLWWCTTARVVHSRVVQVTEMSFIESSKAMGFTNRYIMFRHVFRNVKDIVVARWSLAVASAMIAEAGLSFLGLGNPYQISWGGMISNAFNYGGFVMDLWWWYMAPGLMICICAVSFFLIAMQPKKGGYRLEMM